VKSRSKGRQQIEAAKSSGGGPFANSLSLSGGKKNLFYDVVKV
jgi:hypothetical protein